MESCIQARKEEADTEEGGWVEEDWVRVAPAMEAAGVTVPGTEEAPLGAEAGRKGAAASAASVADWKEVVAKSIAAVLHSGT